MSSLILYDCAISALAECKFVDEASAWVDKAAATQAYARMAKDKTLEVDAAEIRIRAERRLGEMLIEQKAAGGMSKGGRPPETGSATEPVYSTRGGLGKSAVPAGNRTPTLAEVGIGKKLSTRSQKIARVPKDRFEAEVDEWRDRSNAEDERVVARLEAIGDQQPTPKEEADDQSEEIAENYAAAMRIIEADDKLREVWALLAEEKKAHAADEKLREAQALLAKEKKAHAVTQLLYTNQRVELATANRSAQNWKRKFETLEKAAKNE